MTSLFPDSSLAADEGFTGVSWRVWDSVGAYDTRDIRTIHDQVVWLSVSDVSFSAHPVHEGVVQFHRYPDRIYLHWSATPEFRHPVDVFANKLLNLLSGVPSTGGGKAQPKWWNPFRKPETMAVQIFVGVVTSVLGTAILAAVGLLLGII